jgi:cell wall-associated NlpC family hydrolase
VWGGEGRRGIDCSGLPRRAYRDALFANGRAFRLFAQQWWFDASARALGNRHRNDTVALETTGTLREMDYAALQPGDLAVTSNGVHLLVFLGRDSWIHADPGAGAVITMNGRSSTNGWLRSNVTTHRWRELQNEGQK